LSVARSGGARKSKSIVQDRFAAARHDRFDATLGYAGLLTKLGKATTNMGNHDPDMTL